MILSAGVITVREAGGGPRFLLLRAYSYWDFPKGQLMPGELPLQAARREVLEETGIEDIQFPWGEDFYETPRYSRGKVARYYLGRTRSIAVTLGINPELGRPEHHGYCWASAERAMGLLNDRVSAALEWALERMGQGG